MTSTREPIEPDDVYESGEWTAGRRLRHAADTVARGAGTASRTAVDATRTARHYAGSAARYAREGATRAAAPGGAVDWTEERLTRVLDDVSGRVPTSGERTDRAFDTARSTVVVGARRARRLLRG
ncbi:hypothetical protein [Brevibacterium jeotgali]|uniref:Uncharacterized protein n=1 Tax=Brevibacterium jeotgali TaxID=1262550 RepID=A0A2H1L1R0_9MICO|nr:hypothetical protein [Brevibacterium jeotgali]TWC02819.1 hypothetical protein FB108_1521 [Brevibacterium jeotgali]SMY10841.1 hypothetical protein BJEO58_00416 [Brevibacterium jeotgali]